MAFCGDLFCIDGLCRETPGWIGDDCVTSKDCTTVSDTGLLCTNNRCK
jgi:hypothetical protein